MTKQVASEFIPELTDDNVPDRIAAKKIPAIPGLSRKMEMAIYGTSLSFQRLN